jgi:hypothetical protein
MPGLTAVRATGDGNLGWCQPEVLHPAILHKGEGLEKFGRRAEKDRLHEISKARSKPPIYIHHRHMHEVSRFHD